MDTLVLEILAYFMLGIFSGLMTFIAALTIYIAFRKMDK